MDVAAHDLTRTIDCQVIDCNQAAEPGALVCYRHESSAVAGKKCRLDCEAPVTGRYSRGPLANLCADHEQETRTRMSERHSGKPRGGVTVQTGGPVNVPDGSFAEKARALVTVGKRLDSAIARKKREADKLRQQRARLQSRENVLDQDVAAALTRVAHRLPTDRRMKRVLL